ncbi:carboxylesterase/lipase family protein [Nonomuraea sp. FMUSA5-5]|uniref:Carboxylic ester hydrolase n=1 Tax=Nonomuraea composti TaxID=2720023 RepID=A0ABX1BKV2_9ACTN|nr:carboxylesterase family protein [Nonomuraea sp. FMUSA5-5]NJP97025.1 carboxylesterase/lipase family protein [Nonomuraea sp. FMUSA5-5]
MSTTPDPEVRITTGGVRGRTEGGLAVFRGIPYARPARLGAPEPAEPWDGVRDCAAFGPPPPQRSMVTGAVEGGGAESCLTVNVWSPSLGAGARLPVMVWIYGGAYRGGQSGDSVYDGAILAREGNAVVVTLNYRVGMEGFAHLDGAPANRGLLDQVAALEWVRDNVAAFGGDPERVTVFGESAGAGSIIALMAMPRAAGLFGRAIAQSVPGTYFSSPLAADIAGVLAAELGLPPEAGALAAVDPGRLVTAAEAATAKMRQYEDRWGAVAHTVTPFSPVVDGDVLPRDPWSALAAGAGRDVELIVGHTRDEYRLFTQMGQAEGRDLLGVFAPGRERAYRDAYPSAGPDLLDELVQSDWLFRMPSQRLADAQSAGGGRVYAYELAWASPAIGAACHGLDVPLVFGNLGSGMGTFFLGDPAPGEAATVSASFRHAWTRFAAGEGPGWAPYEPEGRLTRVFDVEPAVVPYPEEASRRIWATHTFTTLPLLT